MRKLPVPTDIEELLRKPNPAVLACLRPDGTPLSCPVWYLWRDGEVLLTFDSERKRLRFIRQNPAVSLTVLDGEDWARYVGLSWRVVEISADAGLRVVDEVSRHYMNLPYPDRDRPRVYGRMAVDGWFGWNAYDSVKGLRAGDEAVDRPPIS